MVVEPSVIERKDLLEHLLRSAADKASHGALVERGTIRICECILASALSYKGKPPAVIGDEIGANGDVFGVVLEPINDFVGVAEKNAGERP